jgi:putative transposase
MSKSKHSEAQIIAALGAGRSVEDLAREYGVSKHTIYGWSRSMGENSLGS